MIHSLNNTFYKKKNKIFTDWIVSVEESIISAPLKTAAGKKKEKNMRNHQK